MTLVITSGTLIDGNGRDPLVGSLVISPGGPHLKRAMPYSTCASSLMVMF